MEYQAKFINTIPIMDKHGALQFNQDRSSKGDKVTLKARDDSGTHLEESSLQIYACKSEAYHQRSSSTGFKGFKTHRDQRYEDPAEEQEDDEYEEV